jgi:hypothetical protein
LIAAVDDAADDQERGRTLVRMAVGAPVGNDEVHERIAAGLRDSSQRVREFSVLAAFYSMYPTLRPLLRDVAASDPSDAVRHHARTFLEALDNLGVTDPK